MRKFFCVDIGGTKTAFAIFDEEGNEHYYMQFPTCPEKGAQSLIERIYKYMKDRLGGVYCGAIASPGPLNVTSGEIEHIATMSWKNIPIVDMFEKKFGLRFSLLNDCDAGGLGVWKYGGFSKYQNVCYISISTGIGGGAIVNGKLLTGRGNAANFGHIPVGGDGLQCACGNKDCLELYASGSGLERRFAIQTGEKLSGGEIAQKAFLGDESALKLFNDASKKLALALETIVAILDPEIVVLGGSVCKSKDLFMPYVLKAMPNLKIAYAREDGKQVLYGALAQAKLH